ncbi:hypothetical protein AYJ57_23200 (plasmid) [Salipiger sp. CCB-MM3]|uniref:glycosyltransferase family 2 protein n=1 Tax=Salipiger sp. CCB-MM3 TaxID=1792508 RepID=UPI00080AA7CF|nr:glycosyltransferase family 2 protein [Salipiger sp. CCB-MM3]ANT63393.1 hypothetical protein AYJ57_23200 [Salipiger sp. CCB-MM3]
MPELHSVTVAIAAYAAETFVGAAIRSALQQEGVALDVVVADDASPDKTAEVIERMAAEEPRLSLIRCAANGGPAGARNAAFGAARGDWIAVLDADDAFAPGRLARMCHAGEAQDADIVIDDFLSVTPDGSACPGALLSDRRPSGILSLSDWLVLNGLRRGEVSFGYAKPLFRRRFLEGHGLSYNPDLRNGEDFHLVLEALAKGARVYFTAEPGYLYTRREGSVSRSLDPNHMVALARADARVLSGLAPDVRKATAPLFARRKRNMMRLATTETVLGALKSRHPRAALAGLARHPAAFGRIMGHVAEALRKRVVRAK